jgi:K+-transporting ATPase A subunit
MLCGTMVMLNRVEYMKKAIIAVIFAIIMIVTFLLGKYLSGIYPSYQIVFSECTVLVQLILISISIILVLKNSKWKYLIGALCSIVIIYQIYCIIH